MRARRPRGVDLLPLLDVMMTVTFTFATIREVQLGQANSETAAVSSKASALEASAAAMQVTASKSTKAVTDALARAAKADFDRQSEADRRQAAEAERDRLAQAQSELERRVENLVKEGEAMRDKAFGTGDGERVDSVLQQLLKRNSVLEVELVGVPLATGGIPDNRCCFRTDPRSPTWRSCGTMPALADDLNEWSRRDAGPLFVALEETKGGNALAIIRQAGSATYKSGEKLERYIRARVSDRTVYIEERGLDMPARTCSASR